MNEADTRRELIDPKLKEAGWGKIEKSLIRAAYKINNGEIKPGRIRASYDEADYVLIYKNRKLAVVEAKSDELDVSEGEDRLKIMLKIKYIKYLFNKWKKFMKLDIA